MKIHHPLCQYQRHVLQRYNANIAVVVNLSVCRRWRCRLEVLVIAQGHHLKPSPLRRHSSRAKIEQQQSHRLSHVLRQPPSSCSHRDLPSTASIMIRWQWSGSSVTTTKMYNSSPLITLAKEAQVDWWSPTITDRRPLSGTCSPVNKLRGLLLTRRSRWHRGCGTAI